MTVILWFIISNTYLVFIPVSGAELPKPSEFSKWWEQCCFCYVNEVTFGPLIRMGAGCQGNQLWLGWNFQSHPRPLCREREGLEVESITSGQWFNQSYLWNEASIKTQIGRVQRASGLEMWGEDMETPHPFPMLCPVFIFPLAVPELHPFIINQWPNK